MDPTLDLGVVGKDCGLVHATPPMWCTGTVQPALHRGRWQAWPHLSGAFESSNIPNLYFIGAAAHSYDYRHWTGSGGATIAGTRFMARALHYALEQHRHGVPWPTMVPAPLPTAQALAAAILHRASTSASLYHMHGVLVDLIIISKRSGLSASYTYDIPVHHVTNVVRQNATTDALVLQVSLEWGRNVTHEFVSACIANPPTDPVLARAACGLHPVVRQFSLQNGSYSMLRSVSEFHVLPAQFAVWNDEVLHQRPLIGYLNTVFAGGSAGDYPSTPAGSALDRPTLCQPAGSTRCPSVTHTPSRSHTVTPTPEPLGVCIASLTSLPFPYWNVILTTSFVCFGHLCGCAGCLWAWVGNGATDTSLCIERTVFRDV